jgi:hypothetical protein
MARLRVSLRSILLLTAIVAVLLAGILELNRRLENYVLNPYRLQSTGDLLVDYLENVGDWPNNWNTLRQYAESHSSALQGIRTFRELEANMMVDFTFKPDLVDTNSEWSDENPQIKVVVASDGRTYGAVRSPNETIYRYLQSTGHNGK